MVDSLDLAPPADARVTLDTITSRRGKIVARIMVKQAQTALEDHTKLDGVVPGKLFLVLGENEKRQVIGYVEANVPGVVRWERGESPVAIASLD